MATVKPFSALRPMPGLAEKIAAPPYDVLSNKQAFKLASQNPYSFLHVEQSEIDLEVMEAGPDAWALAAKRLEEMSENGWLLEDERKKFYVYRLEMDGRTQTGLVALVAVDELESGVIKRHELTRLEKEKDRAGHVRVCGAQTGPIFLAFRGGGVGNCGDGGDGAEVRRIIGDWAASRQELFDFVDESGVRHTVWDVDDESVAERIESGFVGIHSLLICDGHHRCAAAAAACREMRKKDRENGSYTGNEPYNYILSVIFPSDELRIVEYNRVIKYTRLSEEEVLAKLAHCFDVVREDAPVTPRRRHEYGMFQNGGWFRLCLKDGALKASGVIDRLDVSVLHELVIEGVFGIAGLRSNDRIDYFGGIFGLERLEKAAAGEGSVAFSLFPTALEDVFEVAESGAVLPPKSTWFEPKLKSGLFVYRI